MQQQSLQQRLNPQSVALGRLLEMSAPEFEDEVRRELDENPALEAIDNTPSQEADHFSESDIDLMRADYADADDIPQYLTRHSRMAASFDPAAAAADDGDTLIDMLMHRLENEATLSPQDRIIARELIGNIDDNGYLTRSLDDVADDIAIADGIDVEPAHVRHIFDIIRALEPAGIGATDLRDCLLLQLDRMPASVAQRTALEIVRNHFDAFSKMHFDKLRSQLGISREDLGEAVELIRTLNPKPASALDVARSADRSRAITPDIALDYNPDDNTFSISLLGNIPELAIEKTFAADGIATDSQDSQSGTSRRNEALAFIRRKRDDAAAFIRLVSMRSETLMAIATAIVTLQRAFFISGNRSDIRPMILKDVSALTGLDLSVISRAVAGKYMLTQHGIYPLKFFFNESPTASADTSSHQILEAISAIIAKEDKKDPISDRELCEQLRQQGIDIARRTVAKYRERLGLPVARLRKEI